MTSKVERAAMRRLIDQFGADVVLQLNRPFERGRTERVSHRLQVDAVIEDCTACRLRAGCQKPLTPLYSPASLDRVGRVAVVGEAPSWEEEAHGELGHGRAGSVLASAMRHAGVPSDRVTYLNTVACWPNDGPRASRPPTTTETRSCQSNVLAAVDAADVDYVILLGAWATRTWRADLTLEKVAGGLYIWRQRWLVIPLQHTNAVLRQHADVEVRAWRAHLNAACQYVADGTGLEGLRTRCIECGGAMYGWDEDGVPWCDMHYDQGRSGRVRRPRIVGGDPRQGTML